MSEKATKPDFKQLDHEVTDMISALNIHLTDLHQKQKLDSSSMAYDEDANENGARIITIAGTNVGATMNGELDGMVLAEEDEAWGTYVNSNFQAINNSIMLGGSCTSNDPGVQVEISDVVKPHDIKSEKAYWKRKEKAAAL